MVVVCRLVRRPELICRGNTRPQLLADRVDGCVWRQSRWPLYTTSCIQGFAARYSAL